jgi:hypothetical protein
MDEHTRNQIIIEQIKLLANDIVDILLKLESRGVLSSAKCNIVSNRI